MSPTQLQAKLREFLALPSETEWVEFKEAKYNYDFDDLGKYFSSLSNEANLKGQAFGWLIFGVKDKPIPRPIVGSQFRPASRSRQPQARNCRPHESPRDVRGDPRSCHPQGRIVMFQIPAALEECRLHGRAISMDGITKPSFR